MIILIYIVITLGVWVWNPTAYYMVFWPILGLQWFTRNLIATLFSKWE